jgi:hypothetical protein
VITTLAGGKEATNSVSNRAGTVIAPFLITYPDPQLRANF